MHLPLAYVWVILALREVCIRSHHTFQGTLSAQIWSLGTSTNSPCATKSLSLSAPRYFHVSPRPVSDFAVARGGGSATRVSRRGFATGVEKADLYAILGVNRNASKAEIKAAYYKLAKQVRFSAPLRSHETALRDVYRLLLFFFLFSRRFSYAVPAPPGCHPR